MVQMSPVGAKSSVTVPSIVCASDCSMVVRPNPARGVLDGTAGPSLSVHTISK